MMRICAIAAWLKVYIADSLARCAVNSWSYQTVCYQTRDSPRFGQPFDVIPGLTPSESGEATWKRDRQHFEHIFLMPTIVRFELTADCGRGSNDNHLSRNKRPQIIPEAHPCCIKRTKSIIFSSISRSSDPHDILGEVYNITLYALLQDATGDVPL